MEGEWGASWPSELAWGLTAAGAAAGARWRLATGK